MVFVSCNKLIHIMKGLYAFKILKKFIFILFIKYTFILAKIENFRRVFYETVFLYFGEKIFFTIFFSNFKESTILINILCFNIQF